LKKRKLPNIWYHGGQNQSKQKLCGNHRNPAGAASAACSESQPMLLHVALFNPKTSISIQNCHPYTGNLNSEMPVDSKNAFLHCGHVSGVGCDASGVPSNSREQTIPWSAHKAQADRPHQAIRPTLPPAGPSCAFHPAAGLSF